MDETAPLLYSQLSGQEKAKKLLGRSLGKERLPHGFLFRGPEGVGKTLFARGLAAAINCKDTTRVQPLEACGQCSSCRKYHHGHHPDFELVVPDNGVIKIRQVREMMRSLEYPPYEAKVRVVVLEDVHAMGREAANALLKTLEEPKPDNVLILTADSSRNLLATLASRCQQIPFTFLGREDTVAILSREGIPSEEGRLLAHLTDGSPGRSLVLRQFGCVALWRDIVTFLMDPAKDVEKDLIEALGLAGRMAELKGELGGLLGLLRRWLRDLLLDDVESLALYCGDFSAGTSKNWSSRELFAKLQALDQADRELARNCNRSLVCEVLLFALQGQAA